MNEGSSERNSTARADQAASDARFGAWECSLQVNGHRDKDGLLIGAVLFLAAWPPFGVFLILKMPLWAQVLSGAAGIIFLCWGLAHVPKPYRKWRSGQALIHFFEDGAVLERTRGRIFALPYDSTAVEYVTWQEWSDAEYYPRTHFLITLSDDQMVMLDALGERELQDLAFIARRWGLPAEPRALGNEPFPARQLW